MIERTLSKEQARAVLALVREREEIVRQANTQVAEINAAIEEQSEVLRHHFELPDGKYAFDGNVNGVVLRMVEPPKDNQQSDEEVADPQADEASE